MTENTDSERSGEPKSVAIEGKLPLKTVGIENLKEANPGQMPPHRYLHPWFARRPTPVSRLATLASILPETTTTDEILEWLQIGPPGMDSNIAEYVEQRTLRLPSPIQVIA